MTPGFSMAITGSTPSGATVAGATGSTSAAAGGDAPATPGDFLGMLGNLAQAASEATIQATTQATTQAAVQAAVPTSGESVVAATLAEVLLPPLPSVTGALDLKPVPSAADARPDTDPATTPEAAAAAASVLAQMLAGMQPVASAASATAQTPTLPPTPNNQAASVAAAALPAPAKVSATADTAASDAARVAPAFTLSISGLAAGEAAPVDEGDAGSVQATPVADLGGRQDAPSVRTAGAMSSAVKSAAPGVSIAASLQPATQQDNATTDSSAFRSLASLLGSGPQRAEGAAAVTTADSLSPQALQSVMSPPAAASATDAAGADLVQDRIRDPVGSAKWADALGARLTMMATRGEQHGSLRLSPEHLGPLEVQIRVQDDKASVWFGAQHADTRAALQDALPRLRELFAASGMQLGDAGVSREAPRQDRTPVEPFAGGQGGESAPTEEPVLPAAVVSVAHGGLLDTYA